MHYDYQGKILEPYSKAPLVVLHDTKLKDFSKLMYFEMYSIFEHNKGKNDYLFITNDTLAEKLSVSTAYIEKTLKDLEDNRYIKRVTTQYSKKKQSKKRLIYLADLQKNENGKVSYTTFPKSLYTLNISTGTKLLLIELISLSQIQTNDKAAIIASNNTLAETFAKTSRTIINSINSLVDYNLIELNYASATEREIYLNNEVIWKISFNEFDLI